MRLVVKERPELDCRNELCWQVPDCQMVAAGIDVKCQVIRLERRRAGLGSRSVMGGRGLRSRMQDGLARIGQSNAG